MWDRGRGQIGEKHLLWLLKRNTMKVKRLDELRATLWPWTSISSHCSFEFLHACWAICFYCHFLTNTCTCAHKATLSPPHTHRLGLTQACGHMMRQTAHRRVIISLLGLCLWGHSGTWTVRGQMLQVHTPLSSALWNMCVQCDNDTETHSAHT